MKKQEIKAFEDIEFNSHQYLSEYRHMAFLNSRTVCFCLFGAVKVEGNKRTVTPRIKVSPTTRECNASTYMTCKDDYLTFELAAGVTPTDLIHHLTKVRYGYVGHTPLNEFSIASLHKLADKLTEQLAYINPARKCKHLAEIQSHCTVDAHETYVEISIAVRKHQKAILALWGIHTQLNRAYGDEHLDLVDGPLMSVQEAYDAAIQSVADNLPSMTANDLKAVKYHYDIMRLETMKHEEYIDLMDEGWEKGEFPDEVMFDAINDVLKLANS